MNDLQDDNLTKPRLETVIGFIQSVTSTPDWTPRTFFQQLKAFSSDSVSRLYWYDTENDRWEYTSSPTTKTVSDDSVASVTPTKNFGKIVIHDNNQEVGEFLYDISNGAITEIADLNGNFETSTSSLGGMTGTDAKITVSADATNGQIDIENRIGAERDFTYLITP